MSNNLVRRFDRRALATVEPRQVRWLVPGLIPLRTLTLVAGIGGVGKSTWLAGIAARLTRGDFLDGDPGNVLIISFEDGASDVLRPRVEAAGGNLERVSDLYPRTLDDLGPVQLPSDVEELEHHVVEGDVRLVIVDPIVAAFDSSLDAHRDQDVRRVLAGLHALADRQACSICIVGHLNKSPSQEAYIRVANSVAFWNACRSVVLITDDPQEPESGRLLAQRKANYSRVQAHPQRWRIEEIVLPDTVDAETGKPIETSKMVYVGVADDVESADVLAPRRSDEERQPSTTGAYIFLQTALADGAWHESASLKEQAEDQGIASSRTLKRAAAGLGVETDRRGFPSVTFWRLAPPQKTLS
jgi:AAA domain